MIDVLLEVSNDPLELEAYIAENFQEVYDYFTNEKYSVLSQERNKIQQYILFKNQVFRNLDINNNINLSFITLLLDVSERLGFLGEFRLLYDQLNNREYNIGSRLKAASFYLVDIDTSDDYLDRFENIYSNLQLAFETEEDTISRVLTTLVNYYAQLVYNFEFNPQAAVELKEKIIQKKLSDPHSFLQHPLIDEILAVPISPHDIAYEKIHQLLDSFLGFDIVRIFSPEDFLLEDQTQYAYLLSQSEADFNTIRNINTTLYQPVQSDTIFHSLQRGVKILEDENQLFAYMYSYGKMHYHKLLSAFQCLPNSFFHKPIRIIDWGCGQAMATIAYLDFLKENAFFQDVRHITLIEPSEIALKRATLHANIFTGGNNILTINKDFDSLAAEELKNSIPTTKLHFFSNILDIDLFSLSNLLNLIKYNYPGENYFICVSPYINDLKISRIDTFVNYFSNMSQFELLCTINNSYGEWISGWSRVIRVFKVRISVTN